MQIVTAVVIALFVILISISAVFPLSDTDECSSNTDDCSHLATCTNTDGSYLCECIVGYTGDGVSCTGNKHCETNAFTVVYASIFVLSLPLVLVYPFKSNREKKEFSCTFSKVALD